MRDVVQESGTEVTQINNRAAYCSGGVLNRKSKRVLDRARGDNVVFAIKSIQYLVGASQFVQNTLKIQSAFCAQPVCEPSCSVAVGSRLRSRRRRTRGGQ